MKIIIFFMATLGFLTSCQTRQQGGSSLLEDKEAGPYAKDIYFRASRITKNINCEKFEAVSPKLKEVFAAKRKVVSKFPAALKERFGPVQTELLDLEQKAKSKNLPNTAKLYRYMYKVHSKAMADDLAYVASIGQDLDAYIASLKEYDEGVVPDWKAKSEGAEDPEVKALVLNKFQEICKDHLIGNELANKLSDHRIPAMEKYYKEKYEKAFIVMAIGKKLKKDDLYDFQYSAKLVVASDQEPILKDQPKWVKLVNNHGDERMYDWFDNIVFVNKHSRYGKYYINTYQDIDKVRRFFDAKPGEPLTIEIVKKGYLKNRKVKYSGTTVQAPMYVGSCTGVSSTEGGESQSTYKYDCMLGVGPGAIFEAIGIEVPND